jgi:competence protein ComEC
MENGRRVAVRSETMIHGGQGYVPRMMVFPASFDRVTGLATACCGAPFAWSRDAVCRLRAACRSEPLPRRPLVVVAGALAVGCAAVRGMPAAGGRSWAMAWWLAAVAALAAWAWWSCRGRSRRAVAALLAGIFAAGAAWSAARFDLFRADDLAWQLAEEPVPVAIMGTVVESFRLLPVPVEDPRRTAAIGPAHECVVRVEAFRAGTRWRPASGRAAVVVDGEPPDLRVGTRVRVLGRGLRPAGALNPGEFDFRLRARSQRCLSIVRVRSAAGMRVVSRPPPVSPGGLVDGLRTRGVAVLEAHLSPARAPLAAALLLGSRESLPREEADDYLATGTVHILSISGLHVGLLSLALFAVLRLLALPRMSALVAVAAVTGGYMILVRAETPVVRATLLVWIACLAAATSRRSPAINALAAAAVVVLAWRPAEIFSSGAQLSFLSTAVLVGVATLVAHARRPLDPIERLIERSRSPAERLARGLTWQAATLFLTGAAVWIVTAPLVASRFHVVSPVGLVVNVLLAPLVAAAMIAGFLCLAAATVSTTLAAVCGGLCDLALAGIAAVVSSAATVPGGHWWSPGPPAWWVVGWYLALLGALLVLPAARLKNAATWAGLAAVWIGVGLAVAGIGRLVTPPSADLRIVMAAMGHGCGIVVRSPAGRTLVYDAGRLGAPGAARRAMAAVLWSEGVSRIDTLVLSHADADHFNAVPELLARFGVGEILVSESFLTSTAATAIDVLERARQGGIPVRTARTGDAFAVDPFCRVRVLHPDAGPRSAGDAACDDDNQTSLVLGIESAGRRLLLTGDIEGPALDRFVTAGPDGCDVLVAPHHGSRTSLPPDIARATRPGLVLVSGVGGRSWDEVRAAYAHAADGEAAVLKTGDEGAIAVTLNAAAVGVARFRDGRWRGVDARAPTPLRPPASILAASGPDPRR